MRINNVDKKTIDCYLRAKNLYSNLKGKVEILEGIIDGYTDHNSFDADPKEVFIHEVQVLKKINRLKPRKEKVKTYLDNIRKNFLEGL